MRGGCTKGGLAVFGDNDDDEGDEADDKVVAGSV
jgi:hypothetical protein